VSAPTPAPESAAEPALLIATGNAHKLGELRQLLPDQPLVGLDAFAPMGEVVEDAPDFAGNAILKARAGLAHTGQICLADDSGISVAALDGAPGVHSARWVPGSDRDRLDALLTRMEGQGDRRAWFTCVIAIAGLPAGFRDAFPTPAGLRWVDDCLLSEGRVDGELALAASGSGGFGYDPIFRLPDGRTAGELSEAEKHQISHRGLAVAGIRPALAAWRAWTQAANTR
jgi:XTP/dITP diphosphohydrolase